VRIHGSCLAIMLWYSVCVGAMLLISVRVTELLLFAAAIIGLTCLTDKKIVLIGLAQASFEVCAIYKAIHITITR
jgi:hypothetical protein